MTPVGMCSIQTMPYRRYLGTRGAEKRVVINALPKAFKPDKYVPSRKEIKMKEGGRGCGKTHFILNHWLEKLTLGEDVVLALPSNAGRSDTLRAVLQWDLVGLHAQVVMVGILEEGLYVDDK